MDQAMGRRLDAIIVAFVGIFAFLGADSPPAATTRGVFPAVGGTAIQNIHRVTSKLLAGAQPETDADFRALRDMGVRTIITVDGARPDVASAEKYGLRYVHLPIGYDRVPVGRGKEIAKAIDELPGLIYLHCHHGKHRSAAAAAVACVYNGSVPPGEAELLLQTFGTGENYKGLWKSARDARPVEAGELARLKVHYVTAARLDDLAEKMVSVDQLWDHVKAIKAAGWKTPVEQPDLDPAHEALMVEEHFAEVGRMPETAKRPEKFRATLAEAGRGSDLLRAALERNGPDVRAEADGAFGRVTQACATCHKSFRD